MFGERTREPTGRIPSKSFGSGDHTWARDTHSHWFRITLGLHRLVERTVLVGGCMRRQGIPAVVMVVTLTQTHVARTVWKQSVKLAQVNTFIQGMIGRGRFHLDPDWPIAMRLPRDVCVGRVVAQASLWSDVLGTGWVV